MSHFSESDSDENDEYSENRCSVCDSINPINSMDSYEMEYCSNRNCDIYMCSNCIIISSSGEIICESCAGTCDSCSEILNIFNPLTNTQINCKICRRVIVICEKCIGRFHLDSCNDGFCHHCVKKCRVCQECVLCCGEIFLSMCKDCLFIQFNESREWLTKSLLNKIFYEDICLEIWKYIKE